MCLFLVIHEFSAEVATVVCSSGVQSFISVNKGPKCSDYLREVCELGIIWCSNSVLVLSAMSRIELLLSLAPHHVSGIHVRHDCTIFPSIIAHVCQTVRHPTAGIPNGQAVLHLYVRVAVCIHT